MIFKPLKAFEGKIYESVWKKLITAGRAHEGLRAEWRQQLTELQEDIGFEYIRFHGIFHDDMMVYHQKENGDVWYSWTYVDSVLDFILSIGIRPSDQEEINILKTYMNPTGTIGFVDGQSTYCESIKIKVHGVVFVEVKQIQ